MERAEWNRRGFKSDSRTRTRLSNLPPVGLPDLGPLALVAQEVAFEWDVELGPPFAFSRYSFVAPAGENAVLKVTPPEDDESDEEADALAFWAGAGAVQLLRRDRERRVMLIQRAWPGTDISAMPDDEATAIAVETGLRLWRPAGEPFRWIGDHVPRWLDHAEQSNHPAPDLIPLARSSTSRSLSVARRSYMAIFTTTTSSTRASSFSPSTPSRCWEMPSLTCLRFCGTRCTTP